MPEYLFCVLFLLAHHAPREIILAKKTATACDASQSKRPAAQHTSHQRCTSIVEKIPVLESVVAQAAFDLARRIQLLNAIRWPQRDGFGNDRFAVKIS